MVWPFTMSFAAILCIAALWVGNGHALRCSAPILLGYLLARVIVNLPIDGSYGDIVFASMWLVIALKIPLGGSDTVTTSAMIRGLIYMAVLCVMWGRFGSYEFKIGSPPYAAADVLVILAMLLIGWNLRHDIIGRFSDIASRNSSMVGNHSISRRGSLDHKEGYQAGQKSEALPASEVRPHV